MEDEATLPAANAAGPPDLVAPVKVGASQLEQDSLMTNRVEEDVNDPPTAKRSKKGTRDDRLQEIAEKVIEQHEQIKKEATTSA